MKYILATECSKPQATKAVIGKMIANILSPEVRQLKVSQTGQNSQHKH